VKLYFVTVNDFKAAEVSHYLRPSGVELNVLRHGVQEILNIDLEVIVRDKALKAFKDVGLPCVVEHGGLYIDALNGLPGGLSKVVWDTVGDSLCGFVKAGDARSATATSVVGYCDGKRLHTFTGETRGSISGSARGAYSFQWDPIFVPDGATLTYGEMGFPEKAKYSQAAKAWNLLLGVLRK
jgi:XTP/dITP diphosphohydrolase